MPKLSILLLLLFFCTAISSSTLAEEETFVITTYYPSPYGSYNELSTNRLAVGYSDAAEQPTRDGDIRLRPQPGDPYSDWEVGKPGQISYSASEDSLYHYNGLKWMGQGGGSGCYVSYSNSCFDGFINKGSIGKYGFCGAIEYDYVQGYWNARRMWAYFLPPGTKCYVIKMELDEEGSQRGVTLTDQYFMQKQTGTQGWQYYEDGEAFVCCSR